MFERIKGLVRRLRPDTGSLGESLAAKWLARERGYIIVARNWRDPHDHRQELDLVALDGPVLVFVEVKTRNASAHVSGYHAVNQRKRRALRRTCDAYLRALPLSRRPPVFRFDVVEVALAPGTAPVETGTDPRIRHFANVPLFRPYYRR